MMRAALTLSVAFFPTLAFAQAQVPAPATMNAVAAAGVSAGTPNAPQNMSGATTAKVPEGLPPPVHQLGPDPQLNKKEVAATKLAASWRNHFDPPVRGEDGVVRWVYGASLPSIVCAPLQVCDLELEPGEVVNKITLGDKVRWLVTPGISGMGRDRTTHVIIKPADSGLVSSMLIFTDRRVYSIKLTSTQRQWTPQTAFTYPEKAESAWAAYGATMASANPQQQRSTGAVAYSGVEFYRVTGSAPWKPVHVYASGGKTIIQFPYAVQYGSAPALVGFARDSGWFSSAPEQMVQYRISGDSYIVDGVLDHAKLVTGVGSQQDRVDIERSR